MLNALKYIGLVFGLVAIVVVFSGATKYIPHPCNLTGVFGGPPACDNNFQWDNDSTAVIW
jgi:hypothetical protein